MLNFCKECGTQLDSNATFCNNCGAKVEAETSQATIQTNNTTTSASADNGIKFDKNLLKIIIPVAAAVIVLIIIISTIVGNGYKNPIKNMVNGFNDEDEEKYCKALPEFLVELYEDADEDYFDNVADSIEAKKESLEDKKGYDLGDDVEASYKIIDKIEIDEDSLESVEKLIDNRYNEEVKVSKGYQLAILFTYEGEDDKLQNYKFVNVYKIEGDWCVLDTGMISDVSVNVDLDDYSDYIDDLF